MSKEEIINSTGNRDLFTTLNETTSVFTQKSTSSTPTYTILDHSATVFTDDNNTFTSYTFKTINTVDDGVLRNIVVTDISNVYTTYLVEYVKQPNGMLGASYTLLTNDDGGLLKSTISITTCEDIGYWKVIDANNPDCLVCVRWVVEEFCNTVTYNIPDTSLDAGNSSNGGGGANTGTRTDTWGTGFPISSGGPTANPGFVTQPSYADDIEILNDFTDVGSNVVAEINRLKGFFNDTKEKGSQVYYGINDTFSVVPLPDANGYEGGTDFGMTNNPNELARVHVHNNALHGTFTAADLYGLAFFYVEKTNLNASLDSRTKTTSFLVSNDGIYAVRVKNPSKALTLAQKANDPYDGPIEFYHGERTKVVQDLILKSEVQRVAKLSCQCEPDDVRWSAAQERAFVLVFNYFKFNEALVVFKGTENSNGSITWSPITN